MVPPRTIWSARAAAALLTGTLAACGDAPTPSQPGPPQPYISILLLTDTFDQVASVQYTAPADSVVILVPRPVTPDSVALVVRAPDGTESPLMPLPGDSGLFGFTLAVTHGQTYRLIGSVVGRPVEATTTVPGPLVVRQPAGDTIRLSLAQLDQPGSLRLPYAWHAPGAAAYRVLTTGLVSGLTRGRVLRDTTGVLLATDLAGNPVDPQTTRFQVQALDDAAGRFLQNIAGALGTFGSASVLAPPKLLVWQ